MAAMDLDIIVQELNRRFSEPLQEFYQRRIIFWYDDERSFEDKIKDINLDNAEIAVLDGKNTFAMKKMICEDNITSNYLVYSPLSFEHDDDNWLINIQLYSEEFRADLNSIWMDEIGLPASPVIRQTVKEFRKYFNAAPRREAVRKLNKNITSASQLKLAVMAAICGNDDIQADKIIRTVLSAGLDQNDNAIYQSMITYQIDKTFWAMIAQGTGYSDENPCLEKLAIHILLTAVSRSMYSDHLAGLERYISEPHQAFCYDLVSEWIRSGDGKSLYNIARYVESAARLYNRFSKLAVEDLIGTECLPCINECILMLLMHEISNEIIQVETIKNAVQKRRTLAWYDEVAVYYDGLLQVANMQAFLMDHRNGFHIMEPHKIWKEYTSDYYKMDTYYRLFHTCFQKSLVNANPLLDDLFKQVADKAEGLYSYWFLGELGRNWTTAAEDSLKQYGRILEVSQQKDFYSSKIKNSSNRSYVIISDALRYEVAAAIADELLVETQCKVNITGVEGAFPTTTPFGMAALLPHSKFSVIESNDRVQVQADGISTDAVYRDKILKQANRNSVALKYKDLINMKRADRQASVKGMDVIYIYHDKIDEASHTSDTNVFAACSDAIAEIKSIVKMIVNDFGGTKIYITADHGFLYTYSPLREDDKLETVDFKQRIKEYGRRYAIMDSGNDPDYLVPVKLFDNECELTGYAPRDNVRIKKTGGGMNYVHGGISLQEMVVPVIEYQYMRTSTKQYKENRESIDTTPVGLTLLSTSRKISNMLFSLNFYQTEPVGGVKSQATYLLYFEDEDGKQISDICKVIADKTSSNGQERTFRCNFNLKSQSYNSMDLYYLVIADETGLQAPVKKEFQINIAFAIDDFGF